MNEDATSLDRLHDIVEPAAAAWWPLAPGWQIVLALAALLTVFLLLRLVARWQRNRYRREALRELRQMMADHHKSANDRARLTALSALLKRTAKTAFPHDHASACNGSEWFAFLDRSAGTRFSDGLGAALEQANYVDSASWGEPQLQELAAAIRHWIRHHRVLAVTAETDASAHTGVTA